MKFKKFLVTAFMATSFVFGLTGCAGGDDTSSDNANDGGGGGSTAATTITLGVWQGSDVEPIILQELVSHFYAQTGIAVEIRTYHDYQTQLQTELIGGVAPDVFYMDAFLLPSLADTGVIQPIDNFIAQTAGFDIDDFFAPALNAFIGPSGSLYGLPKDLSTLGLFYNIELLAYAGFTPDDIPTEIEAFPAFLLELQANLPDGVTAFASAAELARHMFLLEANGTEVVDAEGFAVLSQPDQLGALQLLMDGFHDGTVRRPADLGHDWSGDSFGTQSVALMAEGNWAVEHVQVNFPGVVFGTRELPTINGNPGSMMFTVSYSINASSNNLEAAWAFVEFATGREGMGIWAGGTGLLPTRQSVADDLQLYADEVLAPFVAAADYATPWQKGDTLPIVMREYNNLLPTVISGDMTLQEAMQVAEEAANLDIRTQLR